MAEEYEPPPGPPPNFRGLTNQRNDVNTQPRESWNGAGSESTIASPLASNNPFREDASSVPPGAGRSSAASVPPGGDGNRTFQSPLTQLQTPSQRPSSNQTSDTEMTEEEFQPPPGPPPGHKAKEAEYEPPPGPPPGFEQARGPEPPPYDPWTGPDDNLRAPPSFQSIKPQDTVSPSANASYEDANKGHAWCRQNPLWQAAHHHSQIVARIEAGDIRLTVPPNTTDMTQYFPSLGRSYVRTTSAVHDTIMLSGSPVYASLAQSPLSTGRPKTLYFEVHVSGLGDRHNPNNNVESGIQIGFLAPPYPSWRLPGWHRGSLGVGSDDGRRYVDNSYGGKEFVRPFSKGDVVGIGMTFAPPVHGDRISMRCECFFTRNGNVEGKWDLHEEIDANADEGNIRGLEGEHDLHAAVGLFGFVEFECIFNPQEWVFKP